jgi:predicted TIM-barrel fold metal-dependent hydrolase
MRIFAIARQDSWLCDERTFAVWQQAADLGAHVIVTAFENQLDELRSMLRRFPDVRVSLDHCGFVDAQKPERLLALADEANLFCKISSIVLESAGEECGPFVESLVGAFGSERVMWGSDFCQTHDRSYVELVALARRGFSGLSDAQRQDCFVDTPRLLWSSLA